MRIPKYFVSRWWYLTLALIFIFNHQGHLIGSQPNSGAQSFTVRSPIIPGVRVTEASAVDLNESCTIGVAAGSATPDGRPLVWKTRDALPDYNNVVVYNHSMRYAYLAVQTAGVPPVWMGVNVRGFAILNSASLDLPAGRTGLTNGDFMRYALGTCASIQDFEKLLAETNVTGRQVQANFGVIDSTGGAAIFETGGYEYWKYDARNPRQAPRGYVLRTNFAFHGGGNGGIERYQRTVRLIGDFHSGDSLDYRSIIRHQMRDFSDENSQPVSVPYSEYWLPNRPFGYIYCYFSICRSSTVSAAVIQGVRPGESASLSTLWAILGQPAGAIAVPYWPVGKTPAAANGTQSAPLCDVANLLRQQLFDYAANANYLDSYKLRDLNGEGLWGRIFPAEDSIFTSADSLLRGWRQQPPPVTEMLQAETGLADFALRILQQANQGLQTPVARPSISTPVGSAELLQNYPNPFNAGTTIRFSLSQSNRVRLQIFNLSGAEIETLLDHEIGAGDYSIPWNPVGISSGIYFCRLQTQSLDGLQRFHITKKINYIQ